MAVAETPNPRLVPSNATDQDIATAWDADNQQWWDWYMSLAVADPLRHETVSAPSLPPLVPPDAETLRTQLDRPFSVTDAHRASFHSEGFVKLGGVLEPAGLLALRADALDMLQAAVPSAKAIGFPSLELGWLKEGLLRAYVLSRRLAGIAAQLLGVNAVRLYHDNVLSKNPACGRTPWHYDAHHYPLDSLDVVTAWFPLQPTPVVMGSLQFARDISAAQRVREIPFDKHGDTYDRRIIETLREAAVQTWSEPYALGDVSFHHALSLHSAGSNRTAMPRLAVATTYFADGTRLVQAPTMVSGDYQKFMPNIEPGAVIDSPLNPVVYRSHGASP